MPGAQCTRSLACNVKWHTSVVATVTPGITRHSPRNGFTAYAVLSPATSSCCHRHPRIKVLSARSGRRASANLAPATGARTTRFCRTQKAPISLHAAPRSRGSSRPATPLRAGRFHVHRIPPRARDDARSPLWWDETVRISELIWVGREAKYFCKRGWTRFLQIRSDLPVGLICRSPMQKFDLPWRANHLIRAARRSSLRIDQHAGVEHALRIEFFFCRPKRGREQRRALAIVPGSMITANRVMMGDRATRLNQRVAGRILDRLA